MNHLETQYDSFYRRKFSSLENVYPSEWVVRTLLGRFSGLGFDHENIVGKKILDHSCGYGRNIPFLVNSGFDVYATEISQTIVELLTEFYRKKKVKVEFEVGTGTKGLEARNTTLLASK